MSTEDTTLVANTAYALLKEIADDGCLRELAVAVGESGIPDTGVTKLYLAKLLFSKELYTGCDSLDKLVSCVGRKGLYQRPFPESARKWIEKGARKRNRGSTAAGLRGSPDMDATDSFMKALSVVEGRLTDNSSSAFAGLVRDGQTDWLNVCEVAKRKLVGGGGVTDCVMDALVARRETVGGGLSLVPVDRYLALALATLPYENGVEGLRSAARMTRENLSRPPDGEGQVPTMTTLPVSRFFRRNCIEDLGTSGYSREYYDRHGVSIWNDMFSAHAFSLVGRRANGGGAASDMWLEVTKVLDPELRVDFMGFEKTVAPICTVSKSAKNLFGYRTAEFAVYDARLAEKLATKVIEARLAFGRGHMKKEKIFARLMMRDLLVQGVSVSSVMPRSEMTRFANVFGRFRMW